MNERPTILFADDDRDLERINIRELSEAGYKVVTAKTASEALDVLAQGGINLLILDVMMPTGDRVQDPMKGLRAGIKVAEYVREVMKSNMPIIYQTIFKDQAVHSLIQLIEERAGLEPKILVKPVYIQDLRAEVELCFG